MHNLRSKIKRHHRQSGDTIVEVLISIAIVSIVITGAYALANRSLHQGISASEHDTALKLAEDQIEMLKFRHQLTGHQDFLNKFAGAQPDSLINFCLDPSANPAAPGQTGWDPKSNGTDKDKLQNLTTTAAGGNYNDNCVSSSKYFINISLPSVGGTPANHESQVYLVTVRWNAIGGGQNQSQLYYRISGFGAAGVDGGGPVGGGCEVDDSCPPPPPPTLTCPNYGTFDKENLSPQLENNNPPSKNIVTFALPSDADAGCLYKITVTGKDPTHKPPGPCAPPVKDPNCKQFHEMIFVEGYSKDNTRVFVTGLTPDIEDSATQSSATFEESIKSKALDYILVKHVVLYKEDGGAIAAAAEKDAFNSIHGVSVSLVSE